MVRNDRRSIPMVAKMNTNIEKIINTNSEERSVDVINIHVIGEYRKETKDLPDEFKTPKTPCSEWVTGRHL